MSEDFSNLLFDIIMEGRAADIAHQLGLVSKGWGNWAHPDTGKVVAKTKGDKLVGVHDYEDNDDDSNKKPTKDMSRVKDDKKKERISNKKPNKKATKDMSRVGLSIDSPEAKKKVDEMIDRISDLLVKDRDTGHGAGRFNVDKEDLLKYKNYLEGNGVKLETIKLSDDNLSYAMDRIKEKIGSKSFSKLISSASAKGSPPREIKRDRNRANAVIKSYIENMGKSLITGNFVPFSKMQLDHTISLDNGGKDDPDNWQWLEENLNQFKKNFTDNVVKEKIEKELSQTDDQKKMKQLKQELVNYSRKAYKDYFESSGVDSISQEDVIEAKGDDGNIFMKALADHLGISRYRSAADGQGSRSRGVRLSKKEVKEAIINTGKLRTRSRIKQVDDNLQRIIKSIEEKRSKMK